MQTQGSHVKSKKRISQKSVARTENGKKSKLAPLVVQLDYDEVPAGPAGGGDGNILHQDHYAQDLVGTQEILDMERDFAKDEKQATTTTLNL